MLTINSERFIMKFDFYKFILVSMCIGFIIFAIGFFRLMTQEINYIHITHYYQVDDLNNDGKVNAQDLSIFLSHYPKN